MGHGPGAPGNEKNGSVQRQKIRLQTRVGASEPQKGDRPFLEGRGQVSGGSCRRAGHFRRIWQSLLSKLVVVCGGQLAGLRDSSCFVEEHQVIKGHLGHTASHAELQGLKFLAPK